MSQSQPSPSSWSSGSPAGPLTVDGRETAHDDGLTPFAVEPATAPPRTFPLTRLLALLALVATAAGLFAAGRAGYTALSDGWVAPLRLSPESADVIAIRIQQEKEQSARVRLQSELAGIQADLSAIELSLHRLRSLSARYDGALRWSTDSRRSQLAALRTQKAILQSQLQILKDALARENEAVRVAQANLAVGVVTGVEAQQAELSRHRVEAAIRGVDLELVRVSSAMDEAGREGSALASAARSPARSPAPSARNASPDVVRFDNVQVEIELQLARLEAEKRAAQARERATQANLTSAEQLRRNLEATPLFRAMQESMDLAFVPYSHLRRLRPGDEVYACRWFLVGCRKVGVVKQIFPGEVVAEDPWKSMARGQHVELALEDRAAMTERTLRIRHRREPAADEASLFGLF